MLLFMFSYFQHFAKVLFSTLGSLASHGFEECFHCSIFSCSEEEKLKALRVKGDEDEDEDELSGCMPSSLMLLTVAHEYLGR